MYTGPSSAVDGLMTEPAEINRQPGMVNYLGSEIQSTVVFDMADGKIRTLYVTSNPEKLKRVFLEPRQ